MQPRHRQLVEQPGQPLVEHRDAVARGLVAERAGNPAFADAGRSSGILPGIKTLKSPSITPFTPKRAKLPSLQTGVVVVVRHRSPFASRTGH